MKLVPLTKGYSAIVDDCDFEELMKYKWFVDVRLTGMYIKRHRPDVDGKKGNIYMHRHIMGVTETGLAVDHINRNPLDNRRENLRVCTRAENSRNSIKKTKKTDQMKGVHLRPSGRYGSYIMFERKSICIGTYNTPEAAARAYDQKAIELFGGFANLNFPNK